MDSPNTKIIRAYFITKRDVRTLVHGDDYVSAGTAEQLNWMDRKLAEKFECKAKRLGSRKEVSQQLTILGRVITWTSSGIEYEADPRHSESIVKELGLEDSNLG